MALEHYFIMPFAVSGDRDPVPQTAAATGPVSYEYGYGNRYSLPRETDPLALTIERQSYNEVLYNVTASLQQLQQLGAPWFISDADNGGSAFAYSKGAIVRYDDSGTEGVYISKINSNTTLPTNTTNWILTRIDPAYLGSAQTFTAIQTISASGTPLVINSTNSTALKTTFQDNAVARGGIGASSAYALAAFLPDLTTIAGGWNSSGNLVPGAAASYDVGTSSVQFRAMFANRFEVLGNTAPSNGLYLPAANTPAIAVNSAIGVAFGAGSIGANTTQRHTLPTVSSDTFALLAASQVLTNKTINGANNTISAIALTSLATQAANSIVAEVSGSVASPTAVFVAPNKFFARSSTGNLALKDITDFALTLLDDADAATMRTTLGITSSAAPFSTIAGFLPTAMTFTNSTTASMTITAGQATDSTNASLLAGGSFSWNITNGNAANGYQGGSTLPNSSTIHFYAIATNADTTWSASFASTSLTPTLPGSYTKYRRIFSLFTNGSGVLLGSVGSGGVAIEISGGGILFWSATQILDINITSPATSANRILYALSVPTGIKVQPQIRYGQTDNASGTSIVTSGDETDVQAATLSNSIFSAAPGNDGTATNGTGANTLMTSKAITTNTSGQIGVRSTATTSVAYRMITAGWIDYRR